MAMASLFWVGIVILLVVFTNWVDGFVEEEYEYLHFNETELSLLEAHEASLSLVGENPLLVGLTLIQNAAAKGAGTLFSFQSFSLLFISYLLLILIFNFFLFCICKSSACYLD